MKLLIVEDEKYQMNSYRDTIDIHNRKQDNDNRRIEPVLCTDINKALEKIDKPFDCAIVDLDLNGDSSAGKRAIEKIQKLNLRLPIIVLTGVPSLVDSEIKEICLYVLTKSDEKGYFEKILNKLLDIHSTGITRIIGGQGEIERLLNRVTKHSILPNIYMWVERAKKASEDRKQKIENALLRYTLSHLIQQIDDENEEAFPEEFYIVPVPTSDKLSNEIKYDPLKTGRIVSKDDQYYVVMSPACDLAIYPTKKNYKTDRILLIEIEDGNKVKEETKSSIKDLRKNKHSNYYHWLPSISSKYDTSKYGNKDFDLGFIDFKGGYMNFRKISTHAHDEFPNTFDKPNGKGFFKKTKLQIAPPFIKDIVSRFSSYYARQGQPDIVE